jgi:hypothetical protein
MCDLFIETDKEGKVFVVQKTGSGRTQVVRREVKSKEVKSTEVKGNMYAHKFSSEKPIPDDFAISEEVRQWFGKQKNAHNLEGHFAYFVSKAKSKGYLSPNWDEYFKIAVSENWAKIEMPKYMRGLSKPYSPT